jgi:hypothetical protein
MNPTPTIKTVVLAEVLNRLANKIKLAFPADIQFENDFYWNVSVSEMNDLLQDPKPDVGSLATDISFLNTVVEENYDQQYLDTLRIAAVLRALYLKIDKEGLPEL